VNEKFCQPEACMCNADLSLWNRSEGMEINITEMVKNGSLDDFFEGKNWR
jgi:hypothetical protein